MITGYVRGQVLKLSAVPAAADTINYLTARFVFQTSDWDGLEVWSHWANGDTVYDIRLDDGRITEDMHLNLSAGIWSVYLHGNRYDGGEVVQRVTTGMQSFEVHPTGALDGEPFPELPASVTEQILGRLDQLEGSGGGGTGSGGTSFTPGNALELKNGVLNVKTTDTAEQDNTLPITSAGVYTVVGNIGAILDTI